MMQRGASERKRSDTQRLRPGETPAELILRTFSLTVDRARSHWPERQWQPVGRVPSIRFPADQQISY
jgi:hypothetical protein